MKSGDMSKIGKKPIMIPPGVEIKIDAASLTVKGPKGELKRNFISTVTFEIQDGKLFVKEKDSAMWGLSRALAAIGRSHGERAGTVDPVL